MSNERRATAPKHFTLLILASPSGAGKTTLTNLLLKELPSLRFSVSHTTRGPRPGEVSGKHYHFTTRGEFEQLRDAGGFLEWAEVHGNLYGTAANEVLRAQEDESCTGLIFDVDYQGARQIRAKRPEVVSVFLLPPSMVELEKRLRGRKSDSEEVVTRRLSSALREIEHYAIFDYLIVNDSIDHAFDTLRAIVLAERARRVSLAPVAEALLRDGQLS